MGPYEEPARRLRVDGAEPDIKQMRLTPIDIVTLDDREVRATLVHLTGSSDPVVVEAVVDAVRGVLHRTRGGPGSVPGDSAEP